MRIVYCVLASLALVLLAGAPQAVAQHQGPPCSLDRLAGEWGAVNIGKIGGVEVNAVATVHINKDGTNSAHLLANRGSTYVDFERFGIITVNDDCTTMGIWNDGGPAYHCVTVDDGNEMWCIYEETPGITVTLKRIHTRN